MTGKNNPQTLRCVAMALLCLLLTKPATLLAVNPISWQFETISTSSSRLLQPKSEVALDAVGAPHVIFQRDNAPFNSAGTIYHAFRSGSSWQIQTVASCSMCDVGPNAVFDSSGKLHISYTDAGTLRYGALSGGIWQLEQVPTPGLSVGHTDLAVGTDGIPQIVFNDNNITTTAEYATKVADAWTVQPIATSFSPYSIALDSAGQPVVAGTSSQNLVVARKGPSGWTRETVGVGGFEASLAIGANGVPHIGHAVQNADDLRYATRPASRWTNDVVVNLGPGSFGPSLALGPDGLPRMAYTVHLGAPGGLDDQTMYATFDGAQWITSVLDPRLSTETHLSLTVGGDDISHAVYAIQNGDLIYARSLPIPEPASLGIALGLTMWLSRRRIRSKR
jgi:hypothetical protein